MTRTVRPFVLAASIGMTAFMLGSCTSGSQAGMSRAPLRITSGSPANATLGMAYRQPLTATGGDGSYLWDLTAVTGSSVPPGLHVNCLVLTPPGQGCDKTAASIVGTPTAAGTYNVIVSVSDFESPPQSVSAIYTLTVAP